jgi:membrane fusion protein (multidrug efflux system)
MKRIMSILIVVMIIAAIVLIKIFAFPAQKVKAPATAAAVVAIPVEGHIVQDTMADYRVETVGTLRAREQVDIVSEIQRKLVSIYLKEGSFVKKGQVLFQLDDSDITARIRKLEVDLQLAKANEEREAVLLSRGGISQERFDGVSNHRKVLEAEIDVLKVDLDKTSIRAPFGGRIGIRNVSVGALITPGQVLANLQDVEHMLLDFSVPERYSPNLAPGGEVSFRTDYLTAERTSAIEAVEPSVDQRTRTLLTRAAVDNRDGSLVPGTSAKVFVTIRDREESIYIPTNALIPSISGYTVYKATGGKALTVPVKTGNRNADLVQIREGVGVGDTVLVTNLLRLRNGAPVKILKTH